MAETWDRLLTRWTGAGVLDAESAARIRLFELANAGSNRLRWPIWLALGFGALTLGAGVLLFVSAHWDELSPLARFGLVTGLVAVFHIGGALTGDRFPAMATALHAVGTASVGAGIYLAGQIFNLEEHWPGALMLWAVAAALAWALLKSWTQMALTALLAPAWLVGEWFVAIDGQPSANGFQIPACGVFLLALTYFAAPRADGPADLQRRALIRLGGLALPFASLVLTLAAVEGVYARSQLAPGLWYAGWGIALGLPLLLAAILRRQAAWPHVIAMVWALLLLQLRPVGGDLSLYGWWALGATALAAWGVADARAERINMGAAMFAGTVVAFYFSQVMDKLGRSTSLIGLGLVFLAGGWGIERIRRRLVLQARGGLVS